MSEAKKSKSVGLVVVTQIDGQLVAVLQRRGMAGIERLGTGKPLGQSYAYGCQVTAHGKLEVGESFPGAFTREIREELGTEFAAAVNGYLVATGNAAMCFLVRDEDVHTYGLWLSDPKLLQLIRLHVDSGGIVLVSMDGDRANNVFALADIREFQATGKEHGVSGVTDIAMFPDEIQAVKLALEATWPMPV